MESFHDPGSLADYREHVDLKASETFFLKESCTMVFVAKNIIKNLLL